MNDQRMICYNIESNNNNFEIQFGTRGFRSPSFEVVTMQEMRNWTCVALFWFEGERACVCVCVRESTWETFSSCPKGSPLLMCRSSKSDDCGALQDTVLQLHKVPRSTEWSSLKRCTKCLCCSKRETGAPTDTHPTCVALKWSPVNRYSYCK